MADDDFNNNKSNFKIVTVLELNGILTVKNLRKAVLRALVLKYGQDKNYHRYWKLHQYPNSNLGYCFRKNEGHFIVDDNIKMLDYKYLVCHKKYDAKALAKLHSKILHNTFPPNRSPWDITLITNVPTFHQDQSLVAIRQHHRLGDGKQKCKACHIQT